MRPSNREIALAMVDGDTPRILATAEKEPWCTTSQKVLMSLIMI
jgi:hypothetical protein